MFVYKIPCGIKANSTSPRNKQLNEYAKLHTQHVRSSEDLSLKQVVGQLSNAISPDRTTLHFHSH